MDFPEKPSTFIKPFIVVMIVVFFITVGIFLTSGSLLALVAAAGSKLGALVMIYMVLTRREGTLSGQNTS